MTCEITLEEIPDLYRNSLARSAAQIINNTGSAAYVAVPSEKKGFYYILWAGLNDKKDLEECYFLSSDFVNKSVLINR